MFIVRDLLFRRKGPHAPVPFISKETNRSTTKSMRVQKRKQSLPPLPGRSRNLNPHQTRLKNAHYRTAKGQNQRRSALHSEKNNNPAKNYSTTWIERLSSGFARRKSSEALPPCLAVVEVERQEDTHSKSWQVSFLSVTMDF
jgi:hypothetical protein